MTSSRRPSPKKSLLTGPTYLTIMRMILAVIFFIFILLPITWAHITALAIFIIAAITDKIDGHWARKQKIVTDIGAFLDPLADKMLVNLALLALVSLDIIPVVVFAIILVRDFAVDGLRMMSAQKGITVPASALGKMKTTLQMFALVILLSTTIFDVTLINIVGNILLYISLILTILSGADYMIKGYRQLTK